MKTMTCRQLGGPCEFEHRAETADEAIKAQDRHLEQAVTAGDSAHEPARADMSGRWRHPKKALGWYRAAKRTFADLPSDAHHAS